MQYLTMVAVLGEKETRISVDPKCVEQLGPMKSFYAYLAIKSHCEAVIKAFVEDMGEEAIANVCAEVISKTEGEG